MNEKKLLKMGIDGLDDILNGGLTADRLYLVEGDPGSGKTTLGLQYLLEGARTGQKTLYMTLGKTKQELNAVAESHGWSLDNIGIEEIVNGIAEAAGEDQLTMFHPSEIELGETTKRILKAIEEQQATRAVLDSLSEMRLLAQNSLRYRRQLLALKQFFLEKKCTVLFLDDRTSGTDIQLQSIAHGIISLYQLAPEYGDERRRLRIIKLRGREYRGGFHDFRIKRGGLEVYPRLIASEHYTDFPKKKLASGIVALDNLLGGGIDRGTSTLLMGPAGSGKSTIAFQYAWSATSKGEHATVFAFDESLATIRMRMNALGIEFSEGLSKGQINLIQMDPAEVSPGEFTYMVRNAVENDMASVIIIDSLNGYMNAMPEERFLVIQLHELLSYLNRKGIATLMVVAQHGLIDISTQTSMDTSYLADAVILVRYFESVGRVRKVISVIKKRSGPHEETIRELYFNESGIHLTEPITDIQGVLSGKPSFLASHDDS